MMTTGWSWYVIALIVLNIGGAAWLLWWTAKRRPGDPKPEDTSHVWDGDITEYNKPLPKWWINLFWVTLIGGIAYLLWYPGLGAFAGYGKWTSTGEHDQEKPPTRPGSKKPSRRIAAPPSTYSPGIRPRCAWAIRSSTTPAPRATARPRRARSVIPT
jgi:hypothetical protein